MAKAKDHFRKRICGIQFETQMCNQVYCKKKTFYLLGWLVPDWVWPLNLGWGLGKELICTSGLSVGRTIQDV